MADDYKVTVVVSAKDEASKIIRDLAGGLGNLDTAGKRARLGLRLARTGLKEFAKGAASGVAALTAFSYTAKKAFDLGKEGAAIQQTEESFARLLDKIGAAPDLLDDLRDASRNTVSDLELMSSTTTLLAGVQGELATRLADATPELMEIAKAAYQLNPTLGDTTFMYQSLATGIKRASPLILDNLGLTIRVGEANERYAEILGKTTDELTAEEEKLALLNEALRAGQVLTDQAGDSADSALDDFARLDTAVQNLTDGFKKSLVPALADVAAGLADLFTISEKEREAIEEAEEAARKSATSRIQYAKLVRAELVKRMIAEGESRRATEETFAVTREGNIAILGFAGRTAKHWQEALSWIPGAYEFWQDEIERTKDDLIVLGYETDGVAISTEALEERLRGVAGGAASAQAGLREYVDAEAAAIRETDRLKLAQEMLDAQFQNLAITVRGRVGDELDDFDESQDALIQKAADLEEAIANEEGALWSLGGPQGVGGATTALDVLNGKMGDIQERMDALGPSGDRPWQAEQHMRDLEMDAWKLNNEIERTEELIEGIDESDAAWYGHQARLAELRGELDETNSAMTTLAEDHREAVRRMVYDMVVARASTGEFGDAGYELAVGLAERFGFIDAETKAMMDGVNASLVEFRQEGNVAKVVSDFTMLADATDRVDPMMLGLKGAAPALEDFDREMERARTALDTHWNVMADPIRETAIEMVEGIDEVSEHVGNLVEEEYGIDLDIIERDRLLEAYGTMENITKYLTGTHRIHFEIATTGGFPSGPGSPSGSTPETLMGSPPETYQAGGEVQRTGLALVHAGELIVPRSGFLAGDGGRGNTYVTENVNNLNLTVETRQERVDVIQQFALMRALEGGA